MTSEDWHNETKRFVALLLCGDTAADLIKADTEVCSCNTAARGAAESYREPAEAPAAMNNAVSSMTPADTREVNDHVLLIINGSTDNIEFPMPEVTASFSVPSDAAWQLEIATSENTVERRPIGASLRCEAMSVLLCSLEASSLTAS